MFRLTLNVCSKTFLRCQSSNLKLVQNRAFIIPKRMDNYMACFKYSTIKTDDKPPEEVVENPEHIYRGPLCKQMQVLKLVSLTSSLIGIYLQPVFYQKSLEIGGTPAVIAVCGIIGFFTFVTPLVLHLLTKKYIVDIYYDHERKVYISKTISFFVYKKKLEFTPEDITVPDSLGMFTNCYIKEKPMFFDARFFKDPMYYAKLMGYDKPMDFKLGDDDVNVAVEETKKQ